MRKNNGIKNGVKAFSLMEMMVVLLIVSIVVAASAPMITKRMAKNIVGGGPILILNSGNAALPNMNLLIGTTVPNGNARLQVAGDANIRNQLHSGSIDTGDITSRDITSRNITSAAITASGDITAANNTISAQNVTATANLRANTLLPESNNQLTIGNNNSRTTVNGDFRVNEINNTSGNMIIRNTVSGNNNTIELGAANTTVRIPGNVVISGTLNVVHKASLGTSGTQADQTVVNVNDGDGHTVVPLRSENGDIKACDRRLKNIGEKYTAGLDELKKLEFYNFTFKKDKAKKAQVGVMAQDLQIVFPNAVTKGEDGYLRIRWDEMFYAVINAVKQLDERIAKAVEDIKSNNDKITQLEATIAEQQKVIEDLKTQNEIYEKQFEVFEKRIRKLEKKNK